MTGDLVVVVPGVMGSSLSDSQGREVWGLSSRSLLRALATLGGSIKRLTLPDDVGAGPAEDDVTPRELMPTLHAIPGLWTPIQGYSKLVGFLRQPRFGLTEDEGPQRPGSLILFPYDWRLSNRWTGTLLKKRVEPALERWRASRPERSGAKLVFVCHSMGGLVARWYVERLGGAELTRAVVTLGTPHRGAVKALDQLVNGVRKGVGPLRADLTEFARSLPSSYELLPEYACLGPDDGALAKTTEVELPSLEATRVKAGMSFHEELGESGVRYPLLAVVGIGQPTAAAARIDGDRVESRETIAGRSPAGDGTVPRLAARPAAMTELDPSLRGVAEGHGSLAGARSVTDQLDFLLTAEDFAYRAAELPAEPATKDVLGISVPDLHLPGEPIEVAVRAGSRALEVAAFDADGTEVGSEKVRFDGGLDASGRTTGAANLGPLPAGAYDLICRAPYDPQGLTVRPVRTATLVWAADS